jgi:hypothetical protein
MEEDNIGKDEQNKESNSKAPLKFEYIFISKYERRSKNIAKQQRDTIFTKWAKEKYKIEIRQLREKK